MKKIAFTLFTIGTIGLTSLMAQASINKETFKVWGNCEMCKSTIEAAVSKIDGVRSARWNMLTLKMNVKYNGDKTTLNFIKKSIANVGYDTDDYKTTQEKYNKLHRCCKYERN